MKSHVELRVNSAINSRIDLHNEVFVVKQHMESHNMIKMHVELCVEL